MFAHETDLQISSESSKHVRLPKGPGSFDVQPPPLPLGTLLSALFADLVFIVLRSDQITQPGCKQVLTNRSHPVVEHH